MQYKLSDAVKNSTKGVLIEVRVISRSKERRLEFNQWEPRLKIKIKNPPQGGKANDEIKRFFKDLLGNCEIKSGLLSPEKMLLVRGCKTTEVIKKLEETLENKVYDI